MNIDLTLFCGKNDVREYINQPARIDGGTVATDAAILIWIEDESESRTIPSFAHDAVYERVLQAKQGATREGSWIDPFDVIVSIEDCKKCQGSGVMYVHKCDECDGVGSFWHGSHDYTCQECEGDGTIESSTETDQPGESCHYCIGTGIKDTPSSIGVSGKTVQSCYIQLIRALPNCEILNEPGDMYHFRFDGGVGVVMSYRDEPLKESAA